MLDHSLIQAYIEKILAVKSYADRILNALQPTHETAPQGVWNLVKEYFDTEQTGTLSAKVQEFARQKLPVTEIEKRANCSKSIQYAVSILGENGLRAVVQEFTILPILEQEFELSYEIRSLQAFSEVARIVGTMLVAIASDAAKGVDSKVCKELRLYLESDALLCHHWTDWRSSQSPEAREKVCEVLFKAGQYHDIGMCVISGILRHNQLTERIKKKYPYGFPNDGGLHALSAERALLNNYDHEKVGALYLEGIAESNSIFEKAVYHHSKKHTNIISTLCDIAHDLALEIRNSEILCHTIPSFENIKETVSGSVVHPKIQASYDFMKTSITRAL